MVTSVALSIRPMPYNSLFLNESQVVSLPRRDSVSDPGSWAHPGLVLPVSVAGTVVRLWPTPGSAGAVPHSGSCGPGATVRRMANRPAGRRPAGTGPACPTGSARSPDAAGWLSGRPGRLVLQVAPQMGAAQTATQPLLGGTEELFDDIDGAVRSLRCATRLVAGHGMAGESVAVAVQIAEHDALCPEAAPRPGGQRCEPLVELVVVLLHVGGNGLQAGRGCERGGFARPAGQFVLLQAQLRPQAAEQGPGPLQTVAGACLLGQAALGRPGPRRPSAAFAARHACEVGADGGRAARGTARNAVRSRYGAESRRARSWLRETRLRSVA